MTTSSAKAELTISAAEANRGFSRLLREVRDGASYVVTAHGRPVAKITPCDPDHNKLSPRKVFFERLRNQPVQDIGPWTREELHKRGGD